MDLATVALVSRHFAQAVDFGAPGRVRTLHFVDSENRVFGIVGVEMFVQRHDDGCDFFAAVVAGGCAHFFVLMVGSAALDFVAARHAFAYCSDSVEAEAQHEKRREYDAHGHYCHAETVLVNFCKHLDTAVAGFDDVGA